MAQEIEILYRLRGTKAEAIRALAPFPFLGTRKTTDEYFFDPLRKNLQPTASRHLRESLRIRSQGSQASVTHKTDRFSTKGEWTHSDEFETGIENAEEMRKIFSNFGLKPLVRVVSEKRFFAAGVYRLILEDVPGLGLFLEIESKVVHRQRVQTIKRAMRKFLSAIPLRLGAEMTVGKPELMLRRKRTV